MAVRGAKPKPAALRLVTGTNRPERHGKRSDAETLADQARTAFNPLVKPDHLDGEAAAIWDQLIAPAAWLDGSKFGAAVAFCELWREFRFNPPNFTAGKHGQLRAYMAELGLTDERNRKSGDDGKTKDPADEFF